MNLVMHYYIIGFKRFLDIEKGAFVIWEITFPLGKTEYLVNLWLQDENKSLVSRMSAKIKLISYKRNNAPKNPISCKKKNNQDS